MSKNTENDRKLTMQIEAKDQTGVYANAVSVRVSENEVLIDFGYMLPNVDPATMKIVSRVNLSHRSAESFASILQNALLDFRNKHTG